MHKLFVLALLSMFSAFAPAHAAEWIVDAAGGGQFTDLPAAVAAAAPGDRLLVRPGYYSGARITRGLEIHGLGSLSTISLVSSVVVEDLPAGERVYLSGLSAIVSSSSLVSLRRCLGIVQIERSRSTNRSSSSYLPVQPAVSVSSCRLVTFRSCQFLGFTSSSGQISTPASLSNSTVHFYDCEIDGGHALYCQGQRGGLAISASACTLLFSGGHVYGGSGSTFYCLNPNPWPCIGGRGGDAVSVPQCHITVHGCEVLGGYSGAIVCFGSPPPERTGFAWVGQSLSMRIHPEPLPPVELAASLQMGSTVQVQLELASANPQVLFVALQRAELVLPGLTGALWIDPASSFLVGTTTAAVGPTTIAFPVENEPLAFGYELHFQAIDVRGRCGAPTSAVLQ